MSPTKREKIATLIVEAATTSDKAVCAKYGITVRTLQRYRKLLDSAAPEQAKTDEKAPEEVTKATETVAATPSLSQLVADKKAKVEEGWADEIPGALREAIGFLRRAAKDASTKDPAAIHAVAGAMKLLSETSATWKVLDARLARQNRPVQPANGSAPAGGAGASGPGGGGAGSVVPIDRSRAVPR
jgi:hypothetical protein